MTLLSNKQAWIHWRIAQEKNSIGLAYVLILLLGPFGAHNFYLGRRRLAGVQLLCLVGGSYLRGLVSVAPYTPGSPRAWRNELMDTVGLIALIVVGVTLLIDIFTIPFLVKRQEAEIRRRVMSLIEQDERASPR